MLLYCYNTMEQVIKEYLNINAPKYAEFKGYNEDFINAVSEFTDGAEPTEQVQQFYDEAMDVVKKFQEGGLIEKFQNGGLPQGIKSNPYSWRSDVFSLALPKLLDMVKNGQITAEEFNEYQNSHSASHKSWMNTSDNEEERYKTAWNDPDKKVAWQEQKYQGWGFNDTAIYPNEQKNRYSVYSSNPYSKDSHEGGWAYDNLYSGKHDDRHFGRDGSYANDEDRDDVVNQFKKIGYDYFLNPDTGYYNLRPIKNPSDDGKTNIQTKSDLESGIPNVAHKPFTFGGRISEIFPYLFELGKYFNTMRTNKKIRDLGLQHMPVTSEFTPKHLNIYGNLPELDQSYNEAANLQSKANRLGANTSDYRTGVAINLQGQQQAEQERAQARKAYNDLVRTTSDRATQLEFDNIDKEQENANKNYANTVDNWNYRNDVRMAYENQKHQNYKNFLDYLETEFKQKDLNRKQFYASMLDSQREQAIDNNPEVLRAKEAYRTATNETDKTKAYNNWIDVRNKIIKQITPLYYQELAKIKGIKYNPNSNPFMIYAKSGVKISDDGPVRTRSKDLERHRKSKKDARDSNDKKLDRLGRLMYLHAKGASSRK